MRPFPHGGGIILAGAIMAPFWIALFLLCGCATPPRLPCEFPLWVRVTPDPDTECRALVANAGIRGWKKDNGEFMKDTDIVKGCAPKDLIITNGTDSNVAHEMKHQIERNCR